MTTQQYLENFSQLYQIEYVYRHSYKGYQPAQKWLKDHKDIELGFEDIMHYNKIIVALTETDRLMKEIDNVIEI